MTRRFITKVDIDALLAAGQRTLVLDGDTTLTDLAAEHARTRGVAIDRSDSPAPPRVGDREERMAVRSAVIAALGAVPPDLDDTIDRVLGEH